MATIRSLGCLACSPWPPHLPITQQGHIPFRHIRLCCSGQEALSSVQGMDSSVKRRTSQPPALPCPPVLATTPQAIFNPVSLAYLGDAVWEVFIRQHAWRQLGGSGTSGTGGSSQQGRPRPQQVPTAQLHDVAASWANAAQQARLHDLLLAASQLDTAPPTSLITDNTPNEGASLSTPNEGGSLSRPSGLQPAQQPAAAALGSSSSGQAAGVLGRSPDQGQARPGLSASTVQGPASPGLGGGTDQGQDGPKLDRGTSQGQARAGLGGGTYQGQDGAGLGEVGWKAQGVLRLSASEVDILRWGRNGSTVSPPQGVDNAAYKKATALEVLVAHLYLTDLARCTELIHSLLATDPTGGPAPATGNSPGATPAA